VGYKSNTQNKNLAWFLPRPKKNKYKGGMPLYSEEWIFELANDLMGISNPKILNLFSGASSSGTKIDIKWEAIPDIIGDAHYLPLKSNSYDIVFADPPYSNDEAKKLYGTPSLSYKKYSMEVDRVLRINGLFIIYHKYVMPNPDPNKYYVEKRVFIGNRVYHTPRIAVFFRKK
jgi:hypothetical protein